MLWSCLKSKDGGFALTTLNIAMQPAEWCARWHSVICNLIFEIHSIIKPSLLLTASNEFAWATWLGDLIGRLYFHNISLAVSSIRRHLRRYWLRGDWYFCDSYKKILWVFLHIERNLIHCLRCLWLLAVVLTASIFSVFWDCLKADLFQRYERKASSSMRNA